MQMKAAKWGNSIGVRIPQWVAEQIGINDGSIVEIDFKDDTILIKKKKWSLEEMLNNINPENMHQEIDMGLGVGKEIW